MNCAVEYNIVCPVECIVFDEAHMLQRFVSVVYFFNSTVITARGCEDQAQRLRHRHS